MLAESRRRGIVPTGLAVVGDRLRPEIDGVLRRYVERLRADPAVPMAHDLGVAEVEDHLSSVLMDVVQTLVVLGGSTDVPERLLRDSSEIQRTVAELHGEQRAQLGWTEDAFRREVEIVRDELVAAVHRCADGVPGADIDGAIRLLLGILERAAIVGLRRLQTVRALVSG
jgi:hypothetical protein